jgi:hypothetical protein
VRLRPHDRSSSSEGLEPQRLEIEIIDIPDDPTAIPDQSAAGRRSPRRGSIVVGAALGVAAAGLVVWTLDDGGGRDDPAPPGDAALDERPTTNDTDDRETDAFTASGGPRMPVIDGVVVPTFPQVDNVATQPSDPLDLLEAVVRFDADVPRRSTTTVTLGQGGFQVDVAILRDPVSDRYELEVDAGDGPSWAIVDVGTRTTYFSRDRERWSAQITELGVDRSDIVPVGDLYRRLLDGPVRADTYSSAEVVATGTVQLGPDRPAQAFRVAMPGRDVPLWRLYHLAPTAEFDPAQLPTSMVYDVYVTDDTELLVGLSVVGRIPQLVQHEIELLPERASIALPDAGSVDAPTG